MSTLWKRMLADRNLRADLSLEFTRVFQQFCGDPEPVLAELRDLGAPWDGPALMRSRCVHMGILRLALSQLTMRNEVNPLLLSSVAWDPPFAMVDALLLQNNITMLLCQYFEYRADAESQTLSCVPYVNMWTRLYSTLMPNSSPYIARQVAQDDWKHDSALSKSGLVIDGYRTLDRTTFYRLLLTQALQWCGSGSISELTDFLVEMYPKLCQPEMDALKGPAQPVAISSTSTPHKNGPPRAVFRQDLVLVDDGPLGSPSRALRGPPESAASVDDEDDMLDDEGPPLPPLLEGFQPLIRVCGGGPRGSPGSRSRASPSKSSAHSAAGEEGEAGGLLPGHELLGSVLDCLPELPGGPFPETGGELNSSVEGFPGECPFINLTRRAGLHRPKRHQPGCARPPAPTPKGERPPWVFSTALTPSFRRGSAQSTCSTCGGVPSSTPRFARATIPPCSPAAEELTPAESHEILSSAMRTHSRAHRRRGGPQNRSLPTTPAIACIAEAVATPRRKTILPPMGCTVLPNVKFRSRSAHPLLL
eukprot:RCo041840